MILVRNNYKIIYKVVNFHFTYVDNIVKWIKSILNNPPSEYAVNSNKDKNSTGVPHRVFNSGNNNQEKLIVFITALEETLSKWLEIEAVEFKPSTSIQEGFQRFADWYI